MIVKRILVTLNIGDRSIAIENMRGLFKADRPVPTDEELRNTYSERLFGAIEFLKCGDCDRTHK